MEPVNNLMPFTVNCPICKRDGTAKANQMLQQLSVFRPVESAPPAAAPRPAPARITVKSAAAPPPAPVAAIATPAPAPAAARPHGRPIGAQEPDRAQVETEAR
ncbi:MAG TPA: hypothetical protein VF988_08290, partial [Verrucomicrobiae bacterium]